MGVQRKDYNENDLWIKLCIFQHESAFHFQSGVPKPGVFWVLSPHFFGLTAPTFWRDLKMGAGEGAQQKLGGLEKSLVGKKGHQKKLSLRQKV